MQLLPLQSRLQRLNIPSSAARQKMQITKRGVFLLRDIFSDVVWHPGIAIYQSFFFIYHGGYHYLFVCP